MKKRKTVAVLGMALMVACLMACGSEKKDATESLTDESQSRNEEQVAEISNESDETQSFGLKDYEGFYYQTNTEEVDGYNVINTYGYQFNGDGTGVYYSQDNVEITWNETEIHISDYVYNYDMEPGKLTVHMEQNSDSVFEKLQGRFVKPNPYNIDVNNISDGMYPAAFLSEDIKEADGGCTVSATLFTEDTYDIVDIGQMAEGDIILIDGKLLEVKSIDTLESGCKDINGGIDEGGASLIPEDESNCYVYAGYNDIRTYTNQGSAELKLKENVKLTDESDPTESKEYSGDEAVNQLKILADSLSVSEYNCRVLVENGEIAEITIVFIP